MASSLFFYATQTQFNHTNQPKKTLSLNLYVATHVDGIPLLRPRVREEEGVGPAEGGVGGGVVREGIGEQSLFVFNGWRDRWGHLVSACKERHIDINNIIYRTHPAAAEQQPAPAREGQGLVFVHRQLLEALWLVCFCVVLWVACKYNIYMSLVGCICMCVHIFAGGTLSLKTHSIPIPRPPPPTKKHTHTTNQRTPREVATSSRLGTALSTTSSHSDEATGAACAACATCGAPPSPSSSSCILFLWAQSIYTGKVVVFSHGYGE